MTTISSLNSDEMHNIIEPPDTFYSQNKVNVPRQQQNDIYFQMQGIHQGFNDIQEWDTTAQPYIKFDDLPKAARPQSPFDHSKGDWDFTEDQKKDLRMNGEVNDIFERPSFEKSSPFVQQFKTSDKVDKVKPTINISQISGNMQASEVAQLFYSQKNLQALQNGIRYLVFKRSNGRHTIGEQSLNDLIIIMQSMYLKYGQNLFYNVVEQVRFLNGKVLDFAVPEILKELDMYEKYLKDKSSLPVPLDRSPNVSSKGEKVLEFKGFF